MVERMDKEIHKFRLFMQHGRDELDADLYPLTRTFMSSFADRKSNDPVSPEEIVQALIPVIASLEQSNRDA